jgi:ubiquinone biosynthesis protein
LLLLQKNMLMAEGVSRRLDPSLNIWTLAQPLIDAWMRENRGPEARLREGAEDILRGLRQLPALADNLERATQQLADGSIRIHPESIARLAPRDRYFSRWALPIALIALVIALAALL